MWNKVGFHIAANCGGCSGIGEYWEELDKAGIPFTVYSANQEGVLVSASTYPQATLIYRDVAASTVNPVDYKKPPQTVAAYYWRRTVDALPSFVVQNKARVWVELLNEPGREHEQARWVGGLMYHMARHALLDGYRVMGPGWAAGNPEPEAWEAPEWREYLTLCSLYPDRVAVSLHEYSLENDIRFGAPWHVGRFLQLYFACGRMKIPVPLIFITECGWTLNSMPPRAQAEQDIDFIADWYSQYPEIRCAMLWTLQSGKGNGDLPQRLNALIPWLTEYTITNYQPGDADLPPAGEEPVSDNLLTNGSFEDGWTDAKTFPGQHPKGWEVAWNTGSAYPNPYSTYDYQIGEGVHKNDDLLPPGEEEQFIWDGKWTYKLFAGDKAFWARLKQTLTLPAADYVLTLPVWVDTYRWNGEKDYNLDPNHAEIMVKANGAEIMPWSRLPAGDLQEPMFQFRHSGGVLELAVHFRCNWPHSNNLWLDGWTLEAVTGEPQPAKHKAIVVLAPQNVTKAQWMTIADYAYQFRHTMTASYDDMLTVIGGGNSESYVKVAMPNLQQDVVDKLSGTGIKWMPVLSEQVTPPF